jgi:hypothetical protein
MRTCSKCGTNKEESEYYYSFGLVCKVCWAKRASEYNQRPEVKQRSNERGKVWSKSEKGIKHRKEYRSDPEVKKRLCEAMLRYYYTEKGQKKIQERYARVGRKLSPEQKVKVRAYKREYARNKLHTDAQYRLNQVFSSAIYDALRNKSGKLNKTWRELVGYDGEALKSHLEKRFTQGMTWGNYGMHGWHIDHIIPISAFHYESPHDIDFKKCWALKNLRPLWAADNLKKNDRLESPHQPSLAMAL